MPPMFNTDWLPTTQPMVPYILRLTHSERGDGGGVPDRVWLIGPFADKFERANYHIRHNPEAKPGWVSVNAPVIPRGGALAIPVKPPEDDR